MKILVRIAALALVAGCAHNPLDDLAQTAMQYNDVTSHALILPPEEAARCVVHNIDVSGNTRARIARMYPPETFEVQVRQGTGLVAGVYVTPLGSGSKARAWLQGLNYRRADTVQGLLAGC